MAPCPCDRPLETDNSSVGRTTTSAATVSTGWHESQRQPLESLAPATAPRTSRPSLNLWRDKRLGGTGFGTECDAPPAPAVANGMNKSPQRTGITSEESMPSTSLQRPGAFSTRRSCITAHRLSGCAPAAHTSESNTPPRHRPPSAPLLDRAAGGSHRAQTERRRLTLVSRRRA